VRAPERVHTFALQKEICTSRSSPALPSDHRHQITFAFLSREPSAARDENREHVRARLCSQHTRTHAGTLLHGAMNALSLSFPRCETVPMIRRATSLPACCLPKPSGRRWAKASELSHLSAGSFRASARKTKGLSKSGAGLCEPWGNASSAAFSCASTQTCLRARGGWHLRVAAFGRPSQP